MTLPAAEMHESGKQDLLKQAGVLSASMLQNPTMSSLWGEYYHSQPSPAIGIAEQLGGDIDLRDHPELLVFMKEMIAIEGGALARVWWERWIGENEDEETVSLKEGLNGLGEYLAVQSRGMDLPKPEALPKGHQTLLHVMRHHTAQNPFRPVGTAKGVFAQAWHHLKEEVSEKPKSAAVFTAGCLSALTFMKMRMGSAMTTYVDPQALQVTNLSIDALDDPDFVANVDTSAPLPDLAIYGHDHLALLLNPEAADWLRENAPVLAEIAAKHGPRMKTLAEDAQGRLQGAYDFWNLRVGTFTEDPARNLGEKIIPDSAFKQAFDTGAYHMAEVIYFGNTVENIVLHGLLGFTGFFLAFETGVMRNDEARENMDKVKDFARRSWANSKLSYLFAGSAMTYSYLNGGLSPEMVWMGVAGVVAGEFCEKKRRKSVRAAYAADTTINIRQDLAAFADPEVLVSDIRAGEEPKRGDWLKKLARETLQKKKTMAVAGGSAALCAAEIALNKGMITGYVSGLAAVFVPFLGFNAVEDTAAHIIFLLGGGTAGFAMAMGFRAGSASAGRSKKAFNSVAAASGKTIKHLAGVCRQKFRRSSKKEPVTAPDEKPKVSSGPSPEA